MFTTSDFILPPVRDIPKPQSTIGQISVTETEVYQTLISLDPSKAKGCDGISPRLLKLYTTHPAVTPSILFEFISVLCPTGLADPHD